jgi:hypothetical protein
VLPADAEVDAVRTRVEKLVIAARAGAWKRLRMKSEGTAQLLCRRISPADRSSESKKDVGSSASSLTVPGGRAQSAPLLLALRD